MQEKQVIRGFLANVKVIPPLVLRFQFNPGSIRDNKAVIYADCSSELPGNAPGKKYTGGGHRTISFTFQLHGLEQGSNIANPSGIDNGISTELAKLRSFLYPQEDAWSTVGSLLGSPEEGRRLKDPPPCLFIFGTRILETVVTEINITETQFNSVLAPVRAEVDITLTVVEDAGNALYELDKQRRNFLAALGLQNISPL